MRAASAARVLGVLGLVALCLTVAGCQMLNRSTAGQALQGRVVWPKDGDLWVMDLATKQQTKITNLSSGAAVTGATFSPDGKRVVYAQFWRRPNERSSGADLMLSNADGSDVQPFAERDAPNTVLETPQWAASGRVYYTMRQVNNGRETQTIVRQLQGGQPEKLVDNAYDPAISPNESTLVYVRSIGPGQAMFKKTLDQTGTECQLLSDQVFQYISLPRISLDGKRLAFGGSGEPGVQPTACGGDSSPAAKPAAAGSSSSSGLDLLGLLQPDVAYAHGLPADVYSLNLDGGELTRIADIKDDDPTVAWSPDGAKLAIFGVGALYVVDAKGGPTDKLAEQGGYGGLDWKN